jgi:phosphate transport system substrate-binding protein
MRGVRSVMAVLGAAVLSCGQGAVQAQQEDPAEFVMKHIRQSEGGGPAPSASAAAIHARLSAAVEKNRHHYDYDMSDLPAYQPKHEVVGTVRFWGTNYVSNSGLDKKWRDAFLKFHPKAKVEMVLPSAAVAAPALYLGLADVTMNHEFTFYDYLSFVRILGYEPTHFSVVNGSYDVSGWQNAMAVVVNKANPLTKITMDQLDGVFGSERAGGWEGFKWHPEWARGPEKDIRNWGQLGLTGKWAKQHIQTYGYSIRYATALEFSNKVLKASDKWNGNILAIGNYTPPGGKMIIQVQEILARLEKDPDGIAYVRWQPGFEKVVKKLDVAEKAGGPYVEFTQDNVRNRSYPLWGDQSFWVNIKPGTKIDPNAAEFVRFVLSRDGQELVKQDGLYLPLDAATSRHELEQLARFE